MGGKMPSGSENGLKRQLNPMNVWAIAFGCVIGWGSFINPGKKFLPNSGVAGTAIAMILGAAVMIIIAFSYTYMVPKYPKAGGEFTFTKMCFGKNPAFLCGWFLVAAYLTNVPMNSTAIGLIVDGLDGSADILKFGFHYTIAGFDIYMGEMLLAMSILILFGWLNIIGVRKAGIVQTILSSMALTGKQRWKPKQQRLRSVSMPTPERRASFLPFLRPLPLRRGHMSALMQSRRRPKSLISPSKKFRSL